MEEMVRVAETLRRDHDFRGYIHLKAIAGASPDLMERAGRAADRLSVNVELPVTRRLFVLPRRRTRLSSARRWAAFDCGSMKRKKKSGKRRALRGSLRRAKARK